jgi:hypothetical protein
VLAALTAAIEQVVAALFEEISVAPEIEHPEVAVENEICPSPEPPVKVRVVRSNEAPNGIVEPDGGVKATWFAFATVMVKSVAAESKY